MLRNKPRLTYRGLTVVLSNASRFDKASLLTATGGSLFSNWCLQPEMNSMQCDIRVAEDMSPLLAGTKCVLLCGQTAMHKWLPDTMKNTIGEMRGSPFMRGGVVHIPTFFPQDAADMKAYETQLNPLSADYCPDSDEYETDDDDGDAKRHGKTARRNYAFWLRADTRKAKTIIANGGQIPAYSIPEPVYHIYPSADTVIDLLENTKDGWMYFDIETDYEEANLQCFAFSFNGVDIYSVPILDNNYKPAYSAYHRILRALAIAFQHNTVVAHNGAAFDFFVMAYKYRIAVRHAYDTMLAMHRCFPDVEKSLGHCTSYWTWEKFHKDEDSQGYLTRDQMMARLRYCAKDVRTMYLIHQGIIKYAKTIPGLEHSIETVMSCIRPYLTTTLQGIRYQEEKVTATKKENDELMMQYCRMIRLLIGTEGMKLVSKAVKNPKLFAGSNTQCVEYFHNILGYPVVARSKKTGAPSLGKQAMFKLALKHDNPVIQLVLAYRTVQKEYGTLKFTPWKDDNNQIINYVTYQNSQSGNVGVSSASQSNEAKGQAILSDIIPANL